MLNGVDWSGGGVWRWASRTQIHWMSPPSTPETLPALQTDGAQRGDGDHSRDDREEQVPPPRRDAECDQRRADLGAAGRLPIRHGDARAGERRDDRDRQRVEITPQPCRSGATQRYRERQRSHEIGGDAGRGNGRPEHHSRSARSANATSGARAPATTTATADAPARRSAPATSAATRATTASERCRMPMTTIATNTAVIAKSIPKRCGSWTSAPKIAPSSVPAFHAPHMSAPNTVKYVRSRCPRRN